MTATNIDTQLGEPADDEPRPVDDHLFVESSIIDGEDTPDDPTRTLPFKLDVVERRPGVEVIDDVSEPVTQVFVDDEGRRRRYVVFAMNFGKLAVVAYAGLAAFGLGQVIWSEADDYLRPLVEFVAPGVVSTADGIDGQGPDEAEYEPGTDETDETVEEDVPELGGDGSTEVTPDVGSDSRSSESGSEEQDAGYEPPPDLEFELSAMGGSAVETSTESVADFSPTQSPAGPTAQQETAAGGSDGAVQGTGAPDGFAAGDTSETGQSALANPEPGGTSPGQQEQSQTPPVPAEEPTVSAPYVTAEIVTEQEADERLSSDNPPVLVDESLPVNTKAPAVPDEASNIGDSPTDNESTSGDPAGDNSTDGGDPDVGEPSDTDESPSNEIGQQPEEPTDTVDDPAGIVDESPIEDPEETPDAPDLADDVEDEPYDVEDDPDDVEDDPEEEETEDDDPAGGERPVEPPTGGPVEPPSDPGGPPVRPVQPPTGGPIVVPPSERPVERPDPVILPPVVGGPSEPPAETPEPPEATEPPSSPPVDPPVVAPGPPVETPQPPVETPDPPVEAPEPPVETPDPPVEAPGPPVETPEPPVVPPVAPPVPVEPPSPGGPGNGDTADA